MQWTLQADWLHARRCIRVPGAEGTLFRSMRGEFDVSCRFLVPGRRIFMETRAFYRHRGMDGLRRVLVRKHSWNEHFQMKALVSVHFGRHQGSRYQLPGARSAGLERMQGSRRRVRRRHHIRPAPLENPEAQQMRQNHGAMLRDPLQELHWTESKSISASGVLVRGRLSCVRLLSEYLLTGL